MEKEVKQFLENLKTELLTQDNLATGWPLYCVQQKRIIDGIDLQYDPKIMYVWKDDPEYKFFSFEEAKKAVSNRSESDYHFKQEYDFDDLIKQIGYIEIEEFVCAHLTMKAAKRYIEENKHNLREPRVYVSSQRRCHEFNRLIDILKTGLQEME